MRQHHHHHRECGSGQAAESDRHGHRHDGHEHRHFYARAQELFHGSEAYDSESPFAVDHGHHHRHSRGMLHAMGRHGGPGRHGFGGMGGFGDGDGDAFNRGRKVSSQDLQLLLLAMLADKPAHGYELMKALETLSKGFYTPSPGMVYPALTYLEELGQLSVTQEGNRKSYTLSETGREFLAQNQALVDQMLAKLAHIGTKMDSMRRAYAGEPQSEDDAGPWVPELMAARSALKSALRQRMDASKEEQMRIADVLQQAVRAILGK